jgi:hypothetical protein
MMGRGGDDDGSVDPKEQSNRKIQRPAARFCANKAVVRLQGEDAH